jgi:hypothetical protein
MSRMRAGLSTAVVIALCVSGCGGRDEKPAGEGLAARLAAYAEANHASPEDYIVSKFADHDVVILGEVHRVKHDVKLVQRLIPELAGAGVYYLGTEFARRKDQHLIDSLTTAAEYDEGLARLITLRQYVFWGFAEYTDIYRAAWEYNRSLPEGARTFRILGINNSPDWSLVRNAEDRENGRVMSEVWHGETEADWARVILDSVVAKGGKILVYCGMHHALTHYRQPVVLNGEFIRFGDVRMGNYLYDEIGDRVFSIFLHGPWNSSSGYDRNLVRPADGMIDEAMAEVDPSLLPIAFDTGGTPFGDLPAVTSVYSQGYEDFRLSMFCDGYVYVKPIPGYEGVTPIPDFINEENLDYARAQSPDPWFRDASTEDFNKAIARHADLTKWTLQ